MPGLRVAPLQLVSAFPSALLFSSQRNNWESNKETWYV